MGIKSLLARDLTTTEVVTVPPSMPVTSLARLLADRGISSAPVTSPEGKLLGIVTEADLLRRLAGAEDAPVSWLRGLFGNAERQADTYARTHGLVAADVMTKDVITVAPDATAEHCAHLMEEHRIKRLPVVQEGRLLGIVSRADLLRVVLEAPERAGSSQTADASIRAALRAELRDQPWAGSLYAASEVKDGVVTLFGFVQSDAVRRGRCVLAGRIQGVVRVDDKMINSPGLLPGEFV
ncbi:MAG: hypothetical protein JWO26_3269 [Rhodospirillales bacterium]|jgi:CBS domain-containing protein|nr:hypothetical protein [Rhodospirillales bacterium]